MSDQNDELRFRSFAERYVIERASTFRVGGNEELEDAWNAVARAKTLYNHIREKSLRVAPDAANDEDPYFDKASRKIAEDVRAAQNAKITATVMQRAAMAKKLIKQRSTP